MQLTTKVFTNGCFDLLHSGHIYLFKTIKQLLPSSELIVGLNSDASIRKIKGWNRPIIDEDERMYILSSLSYIDSVILFDDITPIKLIENIKPDILVKGGDYLNQKIIGTEFCKSVLIIPFKYQTSTTTIIEKIENIKK